MPGKPVRIGPFVDGLNNVSLSGESKDTELVELINLEVGPDNLLWSRPPYETIDNTILDGTTVPGLWKVLGVYRTTTTEWYAIVSKPNPSGSVDILAYLMGDFNTTPVTIKTIALNNEVTGFVQMNADCYFMVSPASTMDCFRWQKDTSAVSLPNMKKGFSMIAFQSRLWIAGIDTATQSSRVYFSAIGVGGPTPDVWNTNDYFDCAPGEGGFITALLSVNSNILIFKNDGTWRFSYPASPSKGQVVKLNGGIGAANSTSVVEYDNYVYVYDQGKVYEIVNNTFTQLNRFVKFEKDLSAVDASAIGVDVSIMNRRLIVRYFNSIYAYSIDNQSWSQWRSQTGTPGKLFPIPGDSTVNAPVVFIAASTGIQQSPSTNRIPAFTANQAFLYAAKVGTGNTVISVGTSIVVTTHTTSSIVMTEVFPVSSKQRLLLTGTVSSTGGTVKGMVTFTLRDGSKIYTTQVIDASVSQYYTVPDSAIEAILTITQDSGTDIQYSMQNMNLIRTGEKSPTGLLRIKDAYSDLPITVEHIKCLMRTKAYDFQAPSSIKRLFWWGADIRTNQPISTMISPIATKLPPTWGQLRAYSHTQLHAGTWGNPLSFLTVNLTVADGGDPKNAVTENGRIFVKLIKSIRFRQVSFTLELETLGTKATGPAKVHTLTAYVLPKEKVVDKFS